MSHYAGTYTNIVLISSDGMEFSEFANITVLKVAINQSSMGNAFFAMTMCNNNISL